MSPSFGCKSLDDGCFTSSWRPVQAQSELVRESFDRKLALVLLKVVQSSQELFLVLLLEEE